MKTTYCTHLLSWRDAIRKVTKFKQKKHVNAGYSFELVSAGQEYGKLAHLPNLYKVYQRETEMWKLTVFYEKPTSPKPNK